MSWTAATNDDGYRIVVDEKGKELANCGRHKGSKQLAEQVAALPALRQLVAKTTYTHVDGDDIAIHLPAEVFKQLSKALA